MGIRDSVVLAFEHDACLGSADHVELSVLRTVVGMIRDIVGRSQTMAGVRIGTPRFVPDNAGLMVQRVLIAVTDRT